MDIPFNFILTDELQRCDGSTQNSINRCLSNTVVDIVTSVIYYSGRHAARETIKNSDVLLAIILFLRTQEDSMEYDYDDLSSACEVDSDDSPCSENSSNENDSCDNAEDPSDVDNTESSQSAVNNDDEESVSYDSDSHDDSIFKPDDIAVEARWHYSLNYDAVHSLVWEECSTHLAALSDYFEVLIATLKEKLETTGWHNINDDGFSETLMFDNVTIFLPVLNFLVWNATLAMRGDRRRYCITFLYCCSI